MTAQAVGQWERGDTKPSHETLARVAAALGVSLAEFYGPIPKAKKAKAS